MLRDRKVYEQGPEALAELAERVTDRNYRLFSERGELHVLNGSLYLRGTELDYKEEMMASGFNLRNPNVKRTCGCGASFVV